MYLSNQNDGILDYETGYDRIRIANDKSPETYMVKIGVKKNTTLQVNQTYSLSIDGGAVREVRTDSEGYITVTLSKGAHYLWLTGGSNFVYVNNYSGTGVAEGNEKNPDYYTKDGYYTFAFSISDQTA